MQLRNRFFRIFVPLMGAAGAVWAAADPNALVVTASNTTSNQLLVYNTSGALIQTLPTNGQGGVAQGPTPAASQYKAIWWRW